MNKKLFNELVESMTQMNDIVRGKRAPSRKFRVNPSTVKEIRAETGLSQPKFAALLNVDVGTLRADGPCESSFDCHQQRPDTRQGTGAVA